MDTNEPEVTDLEATEAEAEEQVEDTDDPVALKARIKKLEEKAIAQRERARLLKQDIAKKEKVETEKKSELDNADYALLAAKGIEDEDEVEFIHGYMKKWDKSLRDVLRDSDIQAKLKGMRLEKEVKQAMPSATKRNSSGQIDNLDYWTAKYDQTGELPDNFELRSAVINAKVEKQSATQPPWRR